MNLQGLLEQLQDMAQDNAAFAAQQKADAERTKRSFSQVRRPGWQSAASSA